MRHPTILVADDDRNMRAALRKRLESWGYRVTECRDGLEAVNKHLESRPAAIILDHLMPCGEGRTVARMIRKETDAPIIFISGQEPQHFRTIVQELSDVYYFGKPIDHDRLKALLESLLPEFSRPSATAVMQEINA